MIYPDSRSIFSLLYQSCLDVPSPFKMSSPPAATVLVTGSSGHLGHALMLSLPSHGYTPLGIDILSSSLPNTFRGSITDRAFVNSILASHPSLKHVIHTATLHKPHISTHSEQAFTETNITGTQVLLEEAASHDIASFVFVSTTSVFGSVLAPEPGEPAVWIDEDVTPVPKNIYGITKVGAEHACRRVHTQTGMPVVVLRASRFFPEGDDDERRRGSMGDDNLKVCELAYRRVDIADVVGACVCAARKGASGEVTWGRFIISAPPPFPKDNGTLKTLNAGDGEGVGEIMERCVQGCGAMFQTKGWRFLDRVDRIYDSSRAENVLEWKPLYTFSSAVEKLTKGQEWRSELTNTVGKRGYHDISTGIYTVR